MPDPVTLTLNIKHEMPTSKKFFLFQEAPKIDNTPSSRVFTNVFSVNPATTGNPDGTTTVNFAWKTQFYAVIGTISGDSKNIVTTNLSRKVTLGPKNGSIIYFTGANDSANWGVPPETQDFTGDNGFKFVTDDKFQVDGPSHPFIGVGTVNPKTGKVAALQTFEAVPALGTSFFPKLAYYVTVGDYQPGQFVDKKDVGKWLKIDYQFAQGDRTAEVTYSVNGNWKDEKGSDGITFEKGGVL